MRKPLNLIFLITAVITLESVQSEEQPLAKGIAFYVDASYKRNSEANLVIFTDYSSFGDEYVFSSLDGTSVKANRFAVRKIILIKHLDSDFTNSSHFSDLEQSLLALKEARDKFPKGKSTVDQLIKKISAFVKRGKAGEVFVNGQWIEAEELAATARNKSTQTAKSKPMNVDQRSLNFAGKQVRGVVKEIFPDSVLLMTSNGSLRVPLDIQDQKIKQEFGYDPERAKAYQIAMERNASIQRTLELEQKQEEERRKKASNWIIQIMQTDVEGGFLGKHPSARSSTIYLVRFTEDAIDKTDYNKVPKGFATNETISGKGYLSDAVYSYTTVQNSTNSVRVLRIFEYKKGW